jgi:hypothetical protein
MCATEGARMEYSLFNLKKLMRREWAPYDDEVPQESR